MSVITEFIHKMVNHKRSIWIFNGTSYSKRENIGYHYFSIGISKFFLPKEKKSSNGHIVSLFKEGIPMRKYWY